MVKTTAQRHAASEITRLCIDWLRGTWIAVRGARAMASNPCRTPVETAAPVLEGGCVAPPPRIAVTACWTLSHCFLLQPNSRRSRIMPNIYFHRRARRVLTLPAADGRAFVRAGKTAEQLP
jgi:hypothetical protein